MDYTDTSITENTRGAYPIEFKPGTVASLNPLPSGVTYGALIDGNGATVSGDVLTAGGDDPGTGQGQAAGDLS